MASTITLPDARKLSYIIDAQPQDGPVILLANSLCAPFAAWDHVVPALNKRGFRTLRYDQPGHGDSSAPSPSNLGATTFNSMADDVAILLKYLDISQLHAWIGVSMGAAAGFCYVTRNPGLVRKLIACDTIASSPINAGIDDPFGPRTVAARKAGNMEAITQSTLERWFGTAWLDAHPSEAERMRALMLRTSVDGFETCCHALRSETFNLWPILGKVGASVEDALCVVGSKDANLPQVMDEMRAKVEESFAAAGKPDHKVDLKVIQDAGHVCFVDGFDQFIQVTTAFL